VWVCDVDTILFSLAVASGTTLLELVITFCLYKFNTEISDLRRSIMDKIYIIQLDLTEIALNHFAQG